MLYRQRTAVEQSLASDDTILLAWLRNNGRYLTPAGFLDKSLAITQIFRSFLASLFLLTLMCLVVSGIAISLNTLLVLEPKALATPPGLSRSPFQSIFQHCRSLTGYLM
jgi:hypothetical protein